jgi:hypothetical protein
MDTLEWAEDGDGFLVGSRCQKTAEGEVMTTLTPSLSAREKSTPIESDESEITDVIVLTTGRCQGGATAADSTMADWEDEYEGGAEPEHCLPAAHTQALHRAQ